jgi:hypothetical protein
MTTFNETRVFTWTIGAGPAKASAGGMLGQNSYIKFRDVTDGMSNTMMVGEQSGKIIRGDNINYSWIFPSQGAVTMGANNYTGWLIGCRESGKPPTPDPTGVNDHRYFNVQTIRYRINQSPFADQFFPGMASGMGPNNPLCSFHVGGTHALMGDGAVRFLSENMDLENLKKLATRDDGQPIGEF